MRAQEAHGDRWLGGMSSLEELFLLRTDLIPQCCGESKETKSNAGCSGEESGSPLQALEGSVPKHKPTARLSGAPGGGREGGWKQNVWTSGAL